MNTIKTGLGGAFAAAAIMLTLGHARTDEGDSRKACESLAALSSQTFRVGIGRISEIFSVPWDSGDRFWFG